MSAINDNCCDGLHKLTPMSTANPPGQDTLIYRAGVHATFFETMLARLTDMSLVKSEDARASMEAMYNEARALTGLTTRDSDDPTIALLDAWATVADVLTFYQERIANEGYLRTAIERRSMVEMAMLMGYKPRPGVASSVYLAFTIEDGYNRDLILPKGARVQSTPGPGETAQTFEVSKPLEVRAVWNNLKPRTTLVQASLTTTAAGDMAVYLKGISTNLKPGDALLLESLSTRIPARVKDVLPDAEANLTKVTLQNWGSGTPLNAVRTITSSAMASIAAASGSSQQLDLDTLSKPATPQFDGPANLPRTIEGTFGAGSDMAARLLSTLNPALKSGLYTAWRNKETDVVPFQVYALRAKASPFGHNAPLKPIYSTAENKEGVIVGYEEWPLTRSLGGDGVEQFTIELGNGTSGDGESTHPTLLPVIEITSDVGTPIRFEGQFDLIVPDDITNSPALETTLEFKMDHPSGETVTISVKMRRASADTSNWSMSYQDGDIVLIDFSQRQVQFHWRVSGFQVEEAGTPTVRAVAGSLGIEILVSESGHVSARMDDVFLGSSGYILKGEFTGRNLEATEQANVIALDAVYGQIIPGSLVMIQRPDAEGIIPPIITTVDDVLEVTRADYGITGKGTQLTLEAPWLVAADTTLSTIRATTLYGQSELLPLADVPLTEIELPLGADLLELEELYDGLESGRWIVVTGERADLGDTSGVTGTELAMIREVIQGSNPAASNDPNAVAVTRLNRLEGEGAPPNYAPTHTTLKLAKPLTYTYKVDTVTIYGNVAEATHGETHKETLGAGNGSKANQRFTLKQKPLTFTPASTPSGIESTLAVYVNDLLWHEAASPVDMLPEDREYITQIDNDGNVTVIFGDGERGARLPTGPDNVRAMYRGGIGAVGNVRGSTIDILATRPLGVKGVINPLAATGGADPESRDRIRTNLPLAGRVLGRLISVRDYEEFARVFAGIGKASAVMVNKPPRSVVHVTIAGEGDIPISPDSRLYKSLLKSLRLYGDPNVPVELASRELLSLVIAADVKRYPDYLWESVSADIRAALLDKFSFERRELGQSVMLSEVVSTIQNVPGVEWLDLNAFAVLSETTAAEAFLNGKDLLNLKRDKSGETDPDVLASRSAQAAWLPVQLARPGHDDNGNPIILPAQLAYLLPDVPDTLILNEILGKGDAG